MGLITHRVSVRLSVHVSLELFFGGRDIELFNHCEHHSLRAISEKFKCTSITQRTPRFLTSFGPAMARMRSNSELKSRLALSLRVDPVKKGPSARITCSDRSK